MRAVSAPALLASACGAAELTPGAPRWLLAVGKAASAMAAAFAERHPWLAGGLVVGTHGAAPLGLMWMPSAHPVPDDRSQRAARAALALASGLGPADRLMVLLSGGASSLMALPAGGVSLEDKQDTTRRLLAAGADIASLNCVRKHVSAIKGGRLAAACRAHVDAWLLSDVVGDDPAVIGSGPTAPDPTTFADALDVLDRHGGRRTYPAAIVAHLDAGRAGREPETPKTAGDLPHVATRIIGSAHTALEGAAAEARARGYEVLRAPAPVTGEARDAAAAHVGWIRQVVGRPGRALCVLAGGETTVRVRGQGRGGRNQEFALAAALALGGSPWLLASLGTDGVDGPTAAAGAWVDCSTLARAAALGVDPRAYLDDNDSTSFFERVGGAMVTGPSDTNVGDIQIVLIPAHTQQGAG